MAQTGWGHFSLPGLDTGLSAEVQSPYQSLAGTQTPPLGGVGQMLQS